MRKILLAATGLLVLSGAAAQGIGFGPISLGFHLNPSVETQDGRRAWDLSLSLGVTLALDAANSVEFSGIVDSGPTALGTTVTYQTELTNHVSLGGGMTVLWPVADGARLQTPLFELFARAAAHGDIGARLSGEVSTSLPFLTVAKRTERWAILPLADLPSIGLAADVHLTDTSSLELQVTLQPVIVDTTALIDPLGRVTDDLLILPMLSAFTRFIP